MRPFVAHLSTRIRAFCPVCRHDQTGTMHGPANQALRAKLCMSCAEDPLAARSAAAVVAQGGGSLPSTERAFFEPRLAKRIQVAGGNIKNIVLNAAFFAAADGGVIGTKRAVHGSSREFEKIGKLWDERAQVRKQ